MNKISIYVAFVLLVILSSCSKKNGGEMYNFDEPTIIADFSQMPQGKISFEEAGGTILENGKFNNNAFVQLKWNPDDIMRLYKVDGANLTWTADFKLADGKNSSHGVFRLLKGQLEDGAKYTSVVMNYNSYLKEESNHDFPEYNLPNAFDEVGINTPGYLGNDIIIAAIDKNNQNNAGYITYDGGDYVGTFSFRPNYSLFTFCITSPNMDAGYVLGTNITIFEMEGVKAGGEKVTQTIHLSDTGNSVLNWDNYGDVKILYVPFVSGSYERFNFILTDKPGNTFGAYANTINTDDNGETTDRSEFKKGVRYKRYLTEWSGVDLNLQGYFGFADITSSFDDRVDVW